MHLYTFIKNKLSSSRFWRGLLIQSLILVIIYSGLQIWQTRHAIKGTAPAIHAVSLDGRQFALSDFRGQPVLVHFWASWCRICRFSHSAIDSIAQDYVVLTIATGSGDAEMVSDYVREQGITAPVIVDEQGDWANLYKVKGIPASFIISPEGEVEDVEIGYSSYWGLRIRMFLAGIGA